MSPGRRHFQFDIVCGDFTAKAARRLRGYLIRLTREYTDGGMDSRADKY
jgi:hypothetical protein